MSGAVAAVLFISGALTAGHLVAALFFLRFWRTSHDRLFLFFATAFALLAVQRITLAWIQELGGDTLWSYVLRLAAFVVILAGIIDKNRAS
jgi:hypothetical protein